MQQLLLAAIIITLVSCKGKNALAYNEKMVGIQQELLTKATKMQTDTADALTKLTNVQDFAKKKLAEVKAAEAPSGGDAFKNALIADINAIIESYDVLIKITKAGEDETKLAPLREEFAGWQKKLDKLDDAVIEEQRKFAKANGIQLR